MKLFVTYKKIVPKAAFAKTWVNEMGLKRSVTYAWYKDWNGETL